MTRMLRTYHSSANATPTPTSTGVRIKMLRDATTEGYTSTVRYARRPCGNFEDRPLRCNSGTPHAIDAAPSLGVTVQFSQFKTHRIKQ